MKRLSMTTRFWANARSKLDNYGFFIGKDEAGGGVIGYVDGQLVYLHQGC